VMASDEIGKGGDTISREQAKALVINRCPMCRDGCEDCYGTAKEIDALPAIAPDPSVADAAWKNILFLIDGPSPRWTHGYNVWQATLLREIRTFARAARDGAR